MQQLPLTRSPRPQHFTIPGLGLVSLAQYTRPDSDRVFYSAAEVIAAVNNTTRIVGNPVPAFLRSGNCKDAVEHLEGAPLEDRRLSVPTEKMDKYAAQDPFGRYYFCAEMSSALILYLCASVGLHLLSTASDSRSGQTI